MNLHENSSCSNNINTEGYNNNEEIVPLQAILDMHNNDDEHLLPTSSIVTTSDGKTELSYLKTIFSSRKRKRRISKISARSSASGNDVIHSYNMKSSHTTNSGGDGDNMILSSSNGRSSEGSNSNPDPNPNQMSAEKLDTQEKYELLKTLKIIKAVRAAEKKHQDEKIMLAKAMKSINKRTRCLIQSMSLAKAIKKEAESMVRKEAKEQQEMRQLRHRQENEVSSSSA
jgi:hypothetical protein